MNVGERRAVNECRPDRVKEQLEGAEEGLSEEGVEDEGLDSCGEVGVEACDAQRFVVSEMVWAKRSAVWHANWDVGENR